MTAVSYDSPKFFFPLFSTENWLCLLYDGGEMQTHQYQMCEKKHKLGLGATCTNEIDNSNGVNVWHRAYIRSLYRMILLPHTESTYLAVARSFSRYMFVFWIFRSIQYTRFLSYAGASDCSHVCLCVCLCVVCKRVCLYLCGVISDCTPNKSETFAANSPFIYIRFDRQTVLSFIRLLSPKVESLFDISFLFRHSWTVLASKEQKKIVFFSLCASHLLSVISERSHSKPRTLSRSNLYVQKKKANRTN